MGIPIRVKTDEDMIEYFDWLSKHYEMKGLHGLSSNIALEKDYFLACKDLTIEDWRKIRTPLFYRHTSPKFCESRIDHIVRVLAFVYKYKGTNFNLDIGDIIQKDKDWEKLMNKWKQ